MSNLSESAARRSRTDGWFRVPRRWWIAAPALCLLFAVAATKGRAESRTGPDGDDPAFFEELFARTIAEHDIPGLAAVIVHGDKVVYRGAEGMADASRAEPVDVARTIFPLGSLSKVLTTVAVLQLVERGKIDLDADITRYLGTDRVDRRFSEPVRVRNLLTHTDGFDPRWLFGAAARVPRKVQPLAALMAQLPPRIMPPGRLYLYSDVGMTVAGYIVEQTMQEPFADYMERHVFAPLGMTHTTFRSRRPGYARDRATGYDYDEDGRLRPVPVVYPHATPACGMTAPVADVAPLLIALLNPERPEARAVLGEGSVHAMWARQFTQNPEVPGTGFGVYEYFHHGHRALVHGGLMPGFTSVIMLLPEDRIGLCVAANRFDLVELLEHTLLDETIDRLAPAPTAAPPRVAAEAGTAVAKPAGPAPRLDGRYRCDQYSRFSTDKLVVLAGFEDQIDVTTRPDGLLRFEPAGTLWKKVDPLVYENTATGERVAFRVDRRGRGHRIVGSAQFMSYHRIGWLDGVEMQVWFGGCMTLIAGAGALFACWISLQVRPGNWRRLIQRLLALGLGLAIVGYVLALVATALRLDLSTIAFGEPRLLSHLRYVPALFGLAAAAQLAITIATVRSERSRRAEALIYGTAGFAALLLLPVLHYWNLLRLPFST